MTRIEKLFAGLKRKNKKALIVFLTAGYPDIKTTEKIILDIEKYADIIELGIPFSDPIADGTTIQYSSQKALKKNINLKKIFSIVKNIRRFAKKTNIPLVLMGYLNPIYNFGLKNFFQKAEKTGIDGLIIPDLPNEESREIKKLAAIHNIAFIPLVSLTTEKNRTKKIAESSTGFVYVTAVTGITGARKDVSADLIPYLKMLRKETKKPLLVGFGIAKPEHIKKLKNYCDGFIIGSAIIELIRQKKSVKNFLKGLRSAISNF
ncbi:MAG: tryptophan synthase subunit alpha [Elusimicrobia bacterium HGW-Elusimicrobia-4]|nr:MAG: tryptophan synthase subunit alpha [Elusimicrobia bacterium HGW-Elusimicrobia-4]